MDRVLLERILTSENVVETINGNLEELLRIIPEIKFMINFPHNHPHHHLDVWNHTLLALSQANNDYLIRLTLLLHDIGKPFSYQDGSIRHFKGHPTVSSDMAYDILVRLQYEGYFISKVCKLILLHDTPITDKQIEEDMEFCKLLYQVQVCDALSHHPDKLEKRKIYLEDIHEKLFSEKMKKYKRRKENDSNI